MAKKKAIAEEINTTLSEDEMAAAAAIALEAAEAAEEETAPEVNYPQPDTCYSHKDTLTLDIDGQPVTRRMNDWVRFDPVNLHIAMNKVPFLIARDDFRILMSTLRANHIDYYRRAVGLDILVDIDGKAQLVAARCLYNYEPAKFYKWWSRNEEKVYMTSSEKIKLFLKVETPGVDGPPARQQQEISPAAKNPALPRSLSGHWQNIRCPFSCNDAG